MAEHGLVESLILPHGHIHGQEHNTGIAPPLHHLDTATLYDWSTMIEPQMHMGPMPGPSGDVGD